MRRKDGLRLSQGRFRLRSGKGSSPREWWNTGVGSSWKWSQHEAWESSRSICTTLSDIWCDFWGWSYKGLELDSRILVGPFQPRIFYDFMTFGRSPKIRKKLIKPSQQLCSISSDWADDNSGRDCDHWPQETHQPKITGRLSMLTNEHEKWGYHWPIE